MAYTRLLLILAVLTTVGAAEAQERSRFLSDSYDYSQCDVFLVSQTLEGGLDEARLLFETKLSADDTTALDVAIEAGRATGARCDYAASGYIPDDAALLAELWGVSALDAVVRVEDAITRGETRDIELVLETAVYAPLTEDAPPRWPGPCSEATYCVGTCDARASFDEVRYAYDLRGRLMMIVYPTDVTRLIYEGVDARRPARIEFSDGSAYNLTYDPNVPAPELPWSEEEHAQDSPTRFRPATLESDSDGDGEAELTWTFRYDEAGRLLGEQVTQPDGPTHTITHTIDADGEYTRWSEHTYPDEDEVCVTHPYVRRHPTGQLALTRRFASLCDPDLLAYYQYDASGNLRAVVFDDGADGLPDVITTYTYTCWR